MAELSRWQQEISVGGGDKYEIQVTALENGNFVAVWAQFDGNDFDIIAQIYNADGTAKEGPVIEVNTSGTGSGSNQRFPTVTGLADGGFAVAWVDHTNGPTGADIRARVFNADGAVRNFGPGGTNDFVATQTESGEQTAPRITAYKDGFVISAVGYQGSTGVSNGYYNAVGNRVEVGISGSFESHSISTIIDAPAGTPYAGMFISAALISGSTSTIKLRAHSAAGVQSSWDIPAGSDATNVSVTALSGGRFVVAWKEWNPFASAPYSIYAVIYSADGSASAVKTLASSTNEIEDPVVAALPDGGFVLAYERAGDIRAQTHDQEGVRNGGPITVHEDPSDDQSEPTITVLADGRFLIGWKEIGAGAANSLHAQILDTRDAQNWMGDDTDNSFAGSKHADRLDGGDGNDSLYGGDGIDELIGGIGADYLRGGGDWDIASYVTSEKGLTINLGNTSESTGDAEDDIYVEIDAFYGSNFGDTFLGRDSYDELYGKDGADSLSGGGGNDWLQGDQGSDTLEGGQGNDDLTGGEGEDTLNGGAGNDVLDGGAGADTAIFSGNRALYTIARNTDGTVTVSGPDGTDVLKDVRVLQFKDKVEALSNAAPNGLSLSNASMIENAPMNAPMNAVVGTLAAQDADGDALTYSLAPGSSGSFGIIGNSLVVTGLLDFETKPMHQLTIQASDAYGGVTSLNVNVTVTNAIETTPFTIRGTSRADVLSGEAGNDTIYGSGGNDVLTGNAGKDVFVFDTKLNKSSNVDRITDFRYQDDSIYLDNKYFTKLGSGSFSKPKKFNKDMFFEGKKAQDAEDRIVYDKKTGALYYDQDGTGSKAQVKIATISNKTKMLYSDFFVI